MRFQKDNELGFTSADPLCKTPICVKVKFGVREKVMQIPGWQDRLREFLDQLISEHEGG
jgi:uncharacterized protein (DUF4415 family)